MNLPKLFLNVRTMWDDLLVMLIARLRMYAREFARANGEHRIAYLRKKLRLLHAAVGQRTLLPADPREFYRSAVFEANRAAARVMRAWPVRVIAVWTG